MSSDLPTIDGIKSAAATVQDLIGSLDDVLEEPLKTKFRQVKQEIGAMVSRLPSAEQSALRAAEQIAAALALGQKHLEATKPPPTPPKPAPKKFMGLC